MTIPLLSRTRSSNVVWDVASVPAQRPCRRVGEERRRGGDVKRRVHGAVGDVGEVGHHAQPVALPDHLSAELGQPPTPGSSVALSAQGVFAKWVSVR